MKNINKKVRQIRKRFRINGVPSFDELKNIMSKLGYCIYPYTQADRSRFGERIPPAYTFEFNDSKIVYYDSMLNDYDIAIALAHELAHICLAHSHRTNGPYDTSTYKDYEANVFVYKLFTYKETHIKNIIFSISLVICLSSLVHSSLLMDRDNTTTNIASPAEFVITTSGDKYHNPHCYIVKYKTNVIHVSETEAQKLGKEPCDICIEK